MVLLFVLLILSPGFALGGLIGFAVEPFQRGAAKAVAVGIGLALGLVLLAYVTGRLSNAPGQDGFN